MIDNLKQTELDIFEQQLLDDIFGGHTPEYLVINKGIFKFDLSNDVQNYINKLEEFIAPLMDNQGYIHGSEIKKYLRGHWADVVPEGKFRLIEIYGQVAPLIKQFIGALS